MGPEYTPKHTPCLSRELTPPGLQEGAVRCFLCFNFTSRKTTSGLLRVSWLVNRELWKGAHQGMRISRSKVDISLEPQYYPLVGGRRLVYYSARPFPWRRGKIQWCNTTHTRAEGEQLGRADGADPGTTQHHVGNGGKKRDWAEGDGRSKYDERMSPVIISFQHPCNGRLLNIIERKSGIIISLLGKTYLQSRQRIPGGGCSKRGGAA
jgi:hypothetical protein